MIDQNDEHETVPPQNQRELEEQQLGLEEDDSLPWLESAEDYDDGGSGTGRILGLILLGLVALGLVVGAAYWLQTRDQAPEGDGSLIAAPEGDYKTAPDDPQATEVEGTGDASFAASQGEEPESKLAGSDAGKAAGDGVLVQLGAFSSEQGAADGWASLASRFDFVGGLKRTIVSAKVDGGTVYRLSAVAPNANAANVVCDRLKKAGENCLVIR